MNVTFTAEAAAKIRRVIEAGGDRETGGPLIGHERNGAIVVDDAGGPDWFGGSLTRSAKRIHLCDEQGLELERLHAENGSPSRWLGEFHTHPARQAIPFTLNGRRGYVDQGGARPSPGDEEGWLRDACLYRSPWLGVIVSGREVGAWLVERQPQPGYVAHMRRVSLAVAA